MKWDEYFMRMVYLVAMKSRDPSSKIGAILVKENQIISTGYNGFPIGVNDDDDRYINREIKYAYVVHAEDNVVLSAARFGISTKDTTLYTQDIPCNECCKSVIQGGIKEIIIHSLWPTMSDKWLASQEISKIMLKECGIKVKEFDKRLDVTAYQNGLILTL
jgi:dCMP deaminase